MRFCSTSALSKLLLEINGAIKMQASISIDINIQRLKVSRGVDQTDITCLNKIIRNDDMFPIQGNFNVMRTNGRLNGIGIIETLDIVEVGDVEGSYAIIGCNGEVGKFAVLADVGAGNVQF